MRAILVFGLILLFMSKITYSCIWQIHFYLNQQEITAMECENKNRPEMHCNGKCFLAKKLKLADEQLQTKKDKQSHSLNKIKSIEKGEYWMDQNYFVGVVIAKDSMAVSASFFYLTPLGFNFLKSVFEPPCNA